MNIANPLPPVVPASFPASRAENADAKSASPAGKAESPAAKPESSAATARDGNAQGLDSAQLKQLAELKSRDREVRAHESAHQAAGGLYAGANSYVYERGPDGAQYAVGGEVSIDTTPVDGNPQATIEKMRTIRAAALAPAEPSSQDRSVAAQAMQLMLQAQSELAADSRNDEESQAASADDNKTVRVSQDASDAYQSISLLDESNAARPPSEAFRATA